MADFRLETERLVLRDWREGDWPPFFAHTNTPKVMRWLGGVLDDRTRKPRCWSSAWTATRSSAGTPSGCSSARRTRPSPGDVLGFRGLEAEPTRTAARSGEFEIGWRVREDAWGAGYAREAAERVAARAGSSSSMRRTSSR